MKTYFSLLFVFFIVVGFSQSDKDTANTEPVELPWTLQNATKYIKFSPLDVFSIVPTFGADLEVKLKNEAGLQVGIAGIPAQMQILAAEGLNDYDRMGGYRIRCEARAYMPTKTNRYLSVGLSFRHLIIKDVVAIGMEGETTEWGETNFAYFQNVPMTFNRFNTHFDFKYGFQRVYNDFMLFEMYIGLSLRHVNVQTRSTIPEGGDFPDARGMWTLTDNHNLTYPTPIFGFKFGFVSPK